MQLTTKPPVSPLNEIVSCLKPGVMLYIYPCPVQKIMGLNKKRSSLQVLFGKFAAGGNRGLRFQVALLILYWNYLFFFFR
ncbi:hypothetical protein SLEP1_g52376 [Rubroshorea leprosula]|uniref:Uncharacterized protein n=1 Tax=Rubroshorea leprosula TaxID=152421 RepID=A0AAV5M6Z0_9ROSI|nr:hypothetical protein SLEP1_g52376 [Rubroshorea leprosula]